jgi:nucleotide-binding universal stress UspA family protein
MNAEPRSPVVVGVDGSTGTLAAIQFGAAEARRLATGLKLVHVVPSYTATIPAPMMVLPPDDLVEVGQSILAKATTQAGVVAPDLAIDGELRRGKRYHELSEASVSAPLLVVGRDSRPTLDRVLFGNTATGVACRAACPVVSVPPDWDTSVDHGVVLVGVKSPGHAEELMADAFAIASDRGARLVLLHAWKLASGYDDIVADRVSVHEWNERATDELERILAPWRAVYPAVAVETNVEHDDAAHALERASHHADLLILVRRAHGIPASLHLGGTARAVLRTASCPVRVVPAEAHVAPRDVTEKARVPAGSSS